jgi:hypothetical protein
VVRVGEVEPQERLDHPEAGQDADENHPVGQQFDHAVALRCDVPGVDRQQDHADELRDDVGDLIGRQRRNQAL